MVKLLPWQLAHLGVSPLLSGAGTLVSPELAWLPISAAYALVGVTLAVMLLRSDRAAPHDLIAGTRVRARDANAYAEWNDALPKDVKAGLDAWDTA